MITPTEFRSSKYFNIVKYYEVEDIFDARKKLRARAALRKEWRAVVRAAKKDRGRRTQNMVPDRLCEDERAERLAYSSGVGERLCSTVTRIDRVSQQPFARGGKRDDDASPT